MMEIFTRDYGIEVTHGWGMTEMSPVGTLTLLRAEEKALSPVERAHLASRQGRRMFGVDLKVIPLPDDKDPCDLLQGEGSEVFAALEERAVSFLQFQVESVMEGANVSSAAEKDRLIAELGPVFADEAVAKIGHNLKTRARENIIEYSYFVDGPNGTSSYLLNFDNGGRAVVRGNLLHKGPNADNSILITHYANIWGASYNSLTLEHNTLVSTYPGGRFIDVGTGAPVTLTANLFAGTNGPLLVTGATPTQLNNVVSTATLVPGAAAVAAPNFWPSATLLPQLMLSTIPVPTYTTDAPRPYAVRPVAGTTRLVGALQAAP
jgi:acyl-CoA synthetase (AMP-forming)/AMP-acid ligase II